MSLNIIFVLITLAIFYVVTKAAVKNGILEATKQENKEENKEDNEKPKKQKLFNNPFIKE